MTEKEWYDKNNCSHGHCPLDCEKPQPRIVDDKMCCGKCLCVYDDITEMVPCTPETCDEVFS